MSSFGRRGPALPPGTGATGPQPPAAGDPPQTPPSDGPAAPGESATDLRRTGASTRLLSFEQATALVVATLQDHLPLGLWAVTRCDGDEQVFVEVVHDLGPAVPGAAGTPVGAGGDGGGYDLTAGTVVDWQGSMCQAMVDGAPRVTADATTVPAYAVTGPVDAWPVRTYIASPIATPDGDLYGTLCGYGPEVGDPATLHRMAPVVTLLADLLGQVLLSERLRQQADEREAHLYRLATRDGLTGLATRAVFHDRLTHALELHRGGGRTLTVLLVDVDDFKAVNDTHGHAAGDALLAHLGHDWGSRVRPGNTLARIGGDEFALLVETGLTLEDVVTEITRGLADPITVPGTTTSVTASVGVAHLGPDDPTPTATELLARADRALYATKAAGKAGVTVAEQPSEDPARPGPGDDGARTG